MAAQTAGALGIGAAGGACIARNLRARRDQFSRDRPSSTLAHVEVLSLRASY
jgi:hypothetical protein